MPFDDTRDKASRLLSMGLVAGGLGVAGVRGYKDYQASVTRHLASLGQAIKPRPVPSSLAFIPVAKQEAMLQEAFKVGTDIMGTEGWREFLRRSYESALIGSGTVGTAAERERIVRELMGLGDQWDKARSVIKNYQGDLGGFQGVHDAMKELIGGTVRGKRGKEVAELIRETAEVKDAEGVVTRRYTRRAFLPGGGFWQDRFGMRPQPFVPNLGLLERGDHDIAGLLAREGKIDVSAGVREASRPRNFLSTNKGMFTFNIPGLGEMDLPYTELQIGGKGSEKFLSMPVVPEALERRGLNFVAADHRGMSFASVPHIALPVAGGKYEVVSFNEGISAMLTGDRGGLEGLAQKLHSVAGNKKAQMDLVMQWNTMVRGLYKRVTGGQGDMTQATLHGKSVVAADRLMDLAFGGPGVDKTSLEGVEKFWEAMTRSGYEVSALGSADPMAKTHRLMLGGDYAKRWDLLGEGYPIERRYLSRVRDFEFTPEALEAMERNPIAGLVRRNVPVTATAIGAQEMPRAPMAVAYLSMREGRHLRAEEAVVSSGLAPMMEARYMSRYEVVSGTTQAREGVLLDEGVILGKDYTSRKTIMAAGRRGRVEQRIINAREVGDITELQVETRLPQQSAVKGFSPKLQYIVSGTSMERKIYDEYGAVPGMAVSRYTDDVEMVASADALKKIPQEINKQMSEAALFLSAKRLNDVSLRKVTGEPSKRLRRRIRTGKPTYRFRRGFGRPGPTAGMERYVKDEEARRAMISRRVRSGHRLSKRLGLAGEQEAFAVGAEVMRMAKKWGMDSQDLSLIGGMWYKTLKEAVPDDAQRVALLKHAGLGFADVVALDKAHGVLATPSMFLGGFASFDHRWGRAGMDPRFLMMIKGQGEELWGEAGQMIVEDIARSRIPVQPAGRELEYAAYSVAGRPGYVPGDVERITSLTKAKEALGQRGFMLDYGGKEIYVPGPEAARMGTFMVEPGKEMEQSFHSGYSKYIRALEKVRDLDSPANREALDSAHQFLMEEVHKEWAKTTTLSGKVRGSVSPVARSWVPSEAGKTISREFSSVEDFIREGTDLAFTKGISKETGERMFRDLIAASSDEEKAFLVKERIKFLRGEKITAMSWRHPATRPQSMMPTMLQLVEEAEDTVFIPKVTLKTGDRVLDLSTAAGMKLDTDFDHLDLKIIGDEKTKVAVDKLMNSDRWRRSFVEGVEIQAEIMDQVKRAAARVGGEAGEQTARYINGLRKLVGVKVETGIISNLVGEMRAAAAFNATGRDFNMAAYILAELEEGPIGSKHGLHVGEVKDLLNEFVRGDGGSRVRGAMTEAWDKLIAEGTFTAAQTQFSREEFIDQMARWLSASEDSGELASYRDLVRRGAKAMKGERWAGINQDQFLKVLRQWDAGQGDLNTLLTREMALGVGSSATRARQAGASLMGLGSIALQAFKKHWKWPAMAAVAAVGVSALTSSSNIDMSDHNRPITDLGMGSGIPEITPPSPFSRTIVTAEGSTTPMGYSGRVEGDYSSYGMRQLSTFANDIGSIVGVRDNRGAITPEYVRKAMDERYY